MRVEVSYLLFSCRFPKKNNPLKLVLCFVFWFRLPRFVRNSKLNIRNISTCRWGELAEVVHIPCLPSQGALVDSCLLGSIRVSHRVLRTSLAICRRSTLQRVLAKLAPLVLFEQKPSSTGAPPSLPPGTRGHDSNGCATRAAARVCGPSPTAATHTANHQSPMTARAVSDVVRPPFLWWVCCVLVLCGAVCP